MNEFMDLVLKNLQKNGFPGKRVSLPLEKMYAAAEERGVNFNKVLEQLESEKGIINSKEGERIIFSMKMKMEDIQEMMKNLTPEQLADIQNMYEKMTPEEKEEIMKKGKDMGYL